MRAHLLFDAPKYWRLWVLWGCHCWHVSSTSLGRLGQLLWSGWPRWWFLFLKCGTGECILTIIGSHFLPSLEKLTQRCWKRDSDRSSNFSRSVWRLSWVWNNGPDLHPCRVGKEVMGVCLSYLHVFCGPGEGLSRVTWDILFGVAAGVCSVWELLRAIWS